MRVDGVPLAPDVAPSTVVTAKSAVEGDVVFAVPEKATRADLGVGGVGNEQAATIPPGLKGGKEAARGVAGGRFLFVVRHAIIRARSRQQMERIADGAASVT